MERVTQNDQNPLQIIFLLLIIFTIIFSFHFKYISPYIFLKKNSQLYYNLTIECYQSKLFLTNTIHKTDQMNQEIHRKLVKSSNIGLEYCRRQGYLKNKLISKNIKTSDLRQIELEALGKEFLPFDQLIETLVSGNDKNE